MNYKTKKNMYLSKSVLLNANSCNNIGGVTGGESNYRKQETQ